MKRDFTFMNVVSREKVNVHEIIYLPVLRKLCILFFNTIADS